MISVAPLFLTFMAVSIGAWVSIRFSFFIPKNEDELLFDHIVRKLSRPFSISAIVFVVMGVASLVVPSTPDTELGYNILFLMFFAYVCLILLIDGFQRLDRIWPGRRCKNFSEFVFSAKLAAYERRMVEKLYEAYKETKNVEEREKIAEYTISTMLK